MLNIMSLNKQNVLLSKELELVKQNTYKCLWIFQNQRNLNHVISTTLSWSDAMRVRQCHPLV